MPSNTCPGRPGRRRSAAIRRNRTKGISGAAAENSSLRVRDQPSFVARKEANLRPDRNSAWTQEENNVKLTCEVLAAGSR